MIARRKNPLSEEELRFIREFFSRMSKDANSATIKEAKGLVISGKGSSQKAMKGATYFKS